MHALLKQCTKHMSMKFAWSVIKENKAEAIRFAFDSPG